jgi:hypothetical protein
LCFFAMRNLSNVASSCPMGCTTPTKRFIRKGCHLGTTRVVEVNGTTLGKLHTIL